MSDDLVYLGREDGVATYVKRENITGLDRSMERQNLRNEALGKSQRGLHEWAKENPDAFDAMLKRMGK